MTNEETIDVLEQRKTCMECVVNCTCEECDEAFDIAIRSLEAWKRVKAEINSEIKNLNESALVSDNKDVEVLELEWVLDIIDKHLKEEEE